MNIPGDLCLSPFFTCSDLYVTDIRIIPGSTDNGLPDANLQLLFAKLDTFQYNGDGLQSVADPSQSFFEKISSCCQSIQHLYIIKDPTMTQIPNGFSLLPNLEDAYLSFYFTTSQSVTLKSNPNIQYLTVYGNEMLTEINFDETISFPKLTTLSLGGHQFSGPSLLKTVGNFTTATFPQMTTLECIFPEGSNQLQLFVNHSTLVEIKFPETPVDPPPNAIVTFGSASLSAIKSIDFYGGGLTFQPSLNNFINLSSISSLKYTSMFNNQYPFVSFPLVYHLSFPNSSFTTIPSITLPSYLESLVFKYGVLQGDIDFDTILANTTGNLALDLSDNPLLAVPLELETALCGLKFLDLRETLATSIPPCYWCHNDGSKFYPPTATLPSVSPNAPTQNLAIQFSSTTNTQIFQVIEAGFNVSSVILIQSPNQQATMTIVFSMINTNIPHSTKLNNTGENSYVDNNMIFTFYYSNLAFGQYNLSILNAYYNYSTTVQYNQSYPIVDSFIQQGPYIGNGSLIQLVGFFGNYLTSALVSVSNKNNLYNYSECINVSFTNTTINCQIDLPLSSGLATFNITVDGYSTFKQVDIQSPQQYCTITTNNCYGNGECNLSGICECNSNQGGGGYYNNCSKTYPFITSANVESIQGEQRFISLYGDFGPFGQVNTLIMINNTMNCNITYKSQHNINCTLESSPTTFGFASVQVNSSGSIYSKARCLIFINPLPSGGGTTTSSSSSSGGGETPTPKQTCETTTQNCYGHGTCDNNGKCQCQDKYNPVDNCSTKFTENTTFTPNNTSPSSTIQVGGVEFGFQIIGIQERGLDNEILKELLTSSWVPNITSDQNSDLTNAVYELVVPSNHTLSNTKVTANVSFSTQPRNIPFGTQNLTINPNAIKLSVSIAGWQYSSNVATLLLLLKTTINNEQSIEYDCKTTPVDSFSFGDFGDIQYLRVIKDNVQFNGRFIDFALADGRSTYSQTLLINQTQLLDSSDSSEQSVVVIGITLPQCQECLLDPDFTPLLVASDGDGCSKQDEKWKMIVGIVVGAVGAACLSVGAYHAVKKIRRHMILNGKSILMHKRN
ncbi:hypothetical protein DFA_02819 [Cavenderia fasciculata]|uniref:ComC supersandwich domain-containing protein n=1 Tax=Cavenderia fasciculata TaxID=261658 RepID=F4PIJ6_CACFS|nr:uncharacterized protein DFA_02819 [Cavenderia fasciculata]EGG24576.1 hypothetical protein DFA_02819 [Cavenderia fasciculata]|eukprot:XP_004362427.1 hypothetical protein DFA_02819 [Cavenderia fasciculata]